MAIQKGSSAHDRLTGADLDDTLYGYAGDDILSGLKGNDRLFGDLGKDTLLGGDGLDTLDGGAGDDSLQGDAGNDVLLGGDGNDALFGGADNDTLRGGVGEDRLQGDAGSDQLFGEDGNDTLFGGDAADTLQGGAGDDLLRGDAGNDLVVGGDGADTLVGGAENDTLQGGAGNDRLQGDAGNDVLMGEGGDDRLLGGDGTDTLRGDVGNDTLLGGLGNDLLQGDAGDDLLLGEAGNDLLTAGDGADTLHGGAENDTLQGGAGNDWLQGDAGNDVAAGGDGIDTLSGGADNDTLQGGAGNDTLQGDAGNDVLLGEGDDDRILGGDGADTLRGDVGNDTLLGGLGDDILQGDAGDDLLQGDAGIDKLLGGDGADLLFGGADGDSLQGGAGDDVLQGEAGDDRLLGEDGADQFFGGDGFDFLSGDAGDDVLRGGAHGDTIQGGAGNDWIAGEAGDDLLLGGAGADTFVLGDGLDTINDFSGALGDVIDLTAALAAYVPGTDALADFLRVDLAARAGVVTLSIDANGLHDGVASFQAIGLLNGATYVNLQAMLAEGALLVPTDPAATPDPFSGPDGTTAEFREFLGVNARISLAHDAYSDTALLADSLDYLNIKNVRAGVISPIGNAATAPIYGALADAGIDFDFLLRRDIPATGPALVEDYLEHFKDFLRAHPDSVKAIESVNEIGDAIWEMKYLGMTGIPAVEAFQKDLYQAVNADATLKDIPVFNFTVWESQEEGHLDGYGDMAAWSDAANAHVYIGTRSNPYYEMINRLEDVRLLDSDSPVVITELGYPSNALKGNILSVDQTAQSKLLLNQIMNAYAQDVDTAYIFELFDWAANTPDDNKSNFGLFSASGVAKQAAIAVHNLTEILYKDTGTGPVETVKYDLRGEDANTHAVSMAKAGGVTDLVIWREDKVWDHLNAKAVAVAPRTIEVALDQTAAYVDVYDPIAGTARRAHFTDTDLVTIEITDHPVILEIGL